MNKLIIENKDTVFQNIAIEGTFKRLEIFSVDQDGDVQFSMEDRNEAWAIHVNQEHLKAIVAHLQKQITCTTS